MRSRREAGAPAGSVPPGVPQPPTTSAGAPPSPRRTRSRKRPAGMPGPLDSWRPNRASVARRGTAIQAEHS